MKQGFVTKHKIISKISIILIAVMMVSTAGVIFKERIMATNFVVSNQNDSGNGSLREAINQVNSLCGLGGHSITFGFNTAADTTLGTDRVYSIKLNSELPDLTCNNTTIDGSINNTNTTMLGVGGNTGTNQAALSKVKRPMVEIINNAGLGVGLDIQANNITVRGVAIYGFGTISSAIHNTDIQLGNVSGARISQNIIGSSASQIQNMGSARGEGNGIASNWGPSNILIDHNIIAYVGNSGILCYNQCQGVSVSYNEIRSTCLHSPYGQCDGVVIHDGLDLNINNNLIVDGMGHGIESVKNSRANILDNSFNNNGYGGHETYNNTNGYSPQVLIMGGDNHIVNRNIITNGYSSGIYTNIPNSNLRNNIFGGNHNNAIDIVVNPGITLNSGSSTNLCGYGSNSTVFGNNGIDYPRFKVIKNNDGSVDIFGNGCPNSNVDIYDASAGNGDSMSGNNYGEGVAQIATAVTDVNGFFMVHKNNFSSSTGEISAIITDASNNTSEFSPNEKVITPKIGVSKTLTSIDNMHDGSYRAHFKVIATNVGEIDLENVQIEDNLNNTFMGASGFSVIAGSMQTLNAAANNGYNGTGNSKLLSGFDKLNIGQSLEVSFVVKVDAGTKLGLYENSAIASGAVVGSNGLISVNDMSQDGTAIDPDGDGNPGNNSTPTPITFTENPRIGVAKKLTNINEKSLHEYDLDFEFNIVNMGDVDLHGITLEDNLRSTFPAPIELSINSLSATGDLIADNSFDGVNNKNMLKNLSGLKFGSSATIKLSINIKTAGATGPWNNSAVIKAISPSGVNIDDISQDGLKPDPDNDGNPNNNSIPTPIILSDPAKADLELTKSVSKNSVSLGENLIYTIKVINKGNASVNDVKVLDKVPSSLEVTSFSSNQGSYDSSSGIWNIGSLNVNQEVVLNISTTVTADTDSSIINTAEVISSDRLDPDSTVNNHIVSEDDYDSVTSVVIKKQLATIMGNVFYDINNNGVKDSGENGIANLNIIYEENGVSKIVTTNSSGDYVITTTAPNITIKVDTADSDYPTGYSVTTNSSGGNENQSIATTIGSVTNAKSIGYYKAGVVLSANTNTVTPATNALPSTGGFYSIAISIILLFTTYTVVMVKRYNQ